MPPGHWETAMERRRSTHRRLSLWAALGLAIGALTFPGLAAAADEPNGHASCMGLELGSISPPGTSDEEPGGATQFVREIKEFADFLGAPPGGLFSFVASLHAGSHEACDEALEE
jgi:hypothetical protein